MKYYIVTGTSRGIGEGIVRSLIGDGAIIFSVARNDNEALRSEASKKGGEVRFFPFDLSHTEKIDRFIEELFGEIDFDAAEGVYLINNAGMLGPVGPIDKIPAHDIETHMRVNLLAPMRSCSAFIRSIEPFAGRKVIVNITSGAGEHPYYGWSAYSSSKAALTMCTRVIGEEQREKAHPVIAYAVAPGVVATGMQEHIRSLDEADFAQKHKFVALHEKGLLSAPLEAGRLIAETLDDPRISTGDVIDLRSFFGGRGSGTETS
ncbi:MAG: SDR family NAD(P)-dependent oxidoreductase [Spirochaetaceae bacterium]